MHHSDHFPSIFVSCPSFFHQALIGPLRLFSIDLSCLCHSCSVEQQHHLHLGGADFPEPSCHTWKYRAMIDVGITSQWLSRARVADVSSDKTNQHLSINRGSSMKGQSVSDSRHLDLHRNFPAHEHAGQNLEPHGLNWRQPPLDR